MVLIFCIPAIPKILAESTVLSRMLELVLALCEQRGGEAVVGLHPLQVGLVGAEIFARGVQLRAACGRDPVLRVLDLVGGVAAQLEGGAELLLGLIFAAFAQRAHALEAEAV